MAAASLDTVVFSVLRGDVRPVAVLAPLFLLSVRIATVLAMTPVLYAMPMPGRVRTVLVIALAFALASGLQKPSSVAVDGAGQWIQAAMVEVALGATLSLGVLIAFAAFSMAGHLLDVQIGFGLPQVFDPVSQRPSALLMSTFNYAAVLVFFLVDGHHALLRALAYSVEVFPLGATWSADAVAGAVFKQAGGLFSLGFALAAPVVFCVLMVELALGVVSRNLPQNNMLVLGIPTHIVVGVAALALWLAGMGGSMNRVYASIFDTWMSMFAASAPAESRVDESGSASRGGGR